jgi:hypothetical protein
LLVASQVSRAQSICLRNNRDQVDSGAQSLHHLDIKGLQGVASWSDKVQAGVDTEVNLIGTAWLLLLEHIGLVLVIQELNDGHPRVAVVDIVSKAWGINNGQTNWELNLASVIARPKYHNCSCIPLKNFSSNSALVISISTVLSICLACLRLWSA